MRIAKLLPVLLLAPLVACQTAPARPVDYSAVKDPQVRRTLQERDRQMESGRAAYTARCMAKWSQDDGMVQFCMRTQEKAMSGFLIHKTTWDQMARSGDASPSNAKRYRKCQIAFPSDFEMAAACVENEEAVDRLAASM